MLRTLRRRFILSHVLPLLIIVPLMGIALIYVLETQVLFPSDAQELTREAGLLAEDMSDHSEIWNDRAQASEYTIRASAELAARVMLITPDGTVLASSSDVPDSQWVPVVQRASRGQVAVDAEPRMAQGVGLADVAYPVFTPDKQVIGIIRLTRESGGVITDFMRLRAIIAGVLVFSLILGTIVGWTLALNLERPLRILTNGIYQMSSSQKRDLKLGALPHELNALVQAFNTQSEHLHSLERARRQLLGNLVHELGRTIGALQSSSHALLNGAQNDEELRQELIQGMDGAHNRMRRLVDDLSQLHDQLTGTFLLDRRPVPLSPWLASLLIPWREQAREQGLAWTVQVPPDLPAIVMDPDRMSQAVGNIVSNAIKFTPTGGRVTVSAAVGDGSLEVCIEDTGPGIAPQDQTHIFRPFFQARAENRFPQGMGLGLSIAHDLVHAHGGTIRVESCQARGSRFIVELPLDHS